MDAPKHHSTYFQDLHQQLPRFFQSQSSVLTVITYLTKLSLHFRGTMRVLLLLVFLSLLLGHPSEAQFFRNLANFFRPMNNFFGRIFTPAPRFVDDGTQRPQATGRDEVNPTDCGRDPDKGTGKLCFPDGLLCQTRVNRQGNRQFGNHLYWFSWLSDDASLNTADWNWFNARNYCRKRCMDLVSFETKDEYEWVKQQMSGTKYIWTSGRLCNFDGCDRPDFTPKHINGWFWSANQVRLPPTTDTSGLNDWSFTGGAGVKQPDNREGSQGGGEEACLAVLNNFYGDGIRWHDVECEHKKPIVCEDVEGHLQYARQQFPNINIP